MMSFYQDPPRLGNQYDDDPLFQEYLARALPPAMLDGLRGELERMGALGASLFEQQVADLDNDPVLRSWDAWGKRVDEVVLSPLWREAERLSAEAGLVAIAYERKHGEHSRIHQFALNYLVQQSLDVYCCPLAMTDGAGRTLVELGNQELAARALPRLMSRDPAKAWVSGQWMTEKTGGSDVGTSETVARKTADGWRLFGTKFFTSAVHAQMALTLARPEGNGPGGKGLALFYLEVRDDQGRMNCITINRLKDKLGTRKVPTAELELDGTLAIPVAGLTDGVKNITPMLNVTRTWNSMGAVWGMRRERERQLSRVLTPIAKLTTGKQAVAVTSEAVECFGGAGYMEDTGVAMLLRDAQVLPIWEGTTNVLSLDTLRALGKDGAVAALEAEVQGKLAAARDPGLKPCVDAVKRAMAHAKDWLGGAMADGAGVEAGARRFAMTVGRALELALLVEHAQWCSDKGKGKRAAAAARRLAQNGVDQIETIDAGDSQLLA